MYKNHESECGEDTRIMRIHVLVLYLFITWEQSIYSDFMSSIVLALLYTLVLDLFIYSRASMLVLLVTGTTLIQLLFLSNRCCVGGFYFFTHVSWYIQGSLHIQVHGLMKNIRVGVLRMLLHEALKMKGNVQPLLRVA